jgi:NadR type nicotinamide-nucleotide adenylyltransferase
MEKTTVDPAGQVKLVVITGPECTGKSTLSQQLATHYNTVFVPEYARQYIENLCRPYTYEDVLHIAETQRSQAHELIGRAKGVLFLDTYLIITKVWFDVVFNRHPQWIDDELSRNIISLYLLCDTSIPWQADPVRENGGAMREKLYLMYKDELEKLGCNYSVVSGMGQQRLSSASKAVDQLFNGLTGNEI